MTLAQAEHITTFVEPPADQSTLDRLEELFISRRREIITAKNKRMQLQVYEQRLTEAEGQASDRIMHLASQLTQAEIQRARIELEIIEAAGLLTAENAAKEVVRQ